MMNRTFTLRVLTTLTTIILLAVSIFANPALATNRNESELIKWLSSYATGKNTIEVFQHNRCNIAILTQYEMEGAKFPKRQVDISRATGLTEETKQWAQEKPENKAKIEEILRVFGFDVEIEWEEEYQNLYIPESYYEVDLRKDKDINLRAPVRTDAVYDIDEITESANRGDPVNFWSDRIESAYVKSGKSIGYLMSHFDGSGGLYVLLIELEPDGERDAQGGMFYASPGDIEILRDGYDAKEFLINFSKFINVTYGDEVLGDYVYYQPSQQNR